MHLESPPETNEMAFRDPFLFEDQNRNLKSGDECHPAHVPPEMLTKWPHNLPKVQIEMDRGSGRLLGPRLAGKLQAAREALVLSL